MPLQVYSTLTRKKEPFPRQPGETVSMYVCGPTVYKPAHIGHMVGPVIFDTVKRYLLHLGFKVNWIVNITDVDDKLIGRARELNVTVTALSEAMTKDYFDCLAKLNVTGIDHFPKATEHISGMVTMIEALIAKGHAYPSGGDVYFDVTRDDDYGKLCNRGIEDDPEARPDATGKKRNPGDFALWKAAKPDEPPEVQFGSPWGKGRPGWHIECSAMSLALLGETIDIHGGGLDLTFPHHENELAQSECCNGVPFAKIWMHNGLLKLKNKDGKEDKMAGSLGNVLNVADALKHIPGGALRLFMLQTHYRSPIDLGIWDWNDKAKPIPDGLVAARAAFETFLRFAERVERVLGEPFAEVHTSLAIDPKTAAMMKKFETFLDDDFNTGGAVGLLFELVTALNKLADDGKLEDPAFAKPPERAEFAAGVGLVRDITAILGLELSAPKVELGGGDELVKGLMQLILDLRANLRTEAKGAAKDNPLKKALFDQTDLIRKRLGELNVTLEDRPAGTTWRVG